MTSTAASATLLAGLEPNGQAAQASGVTGPVSKPFTTQLYTLRDYEALRSSSYDRKGGNADFRKIEPGGNVELLAAQGPAVLTHIWIVFSAREEYHLKKLVLRAYWDGEKKPSIEAPVGDFFGLTLGEYFLYQSALTNVAPIKAMNSYFPMPFATQARMTVTNEGSSVVDGVWFNIDYVKLPELPPHSAYFHAQYRQSAPCRGWTDDWRNQYVPAINDKSNLSGEGNYVFLEAHGRGHFLGVTQGVLQNQAGWWGEGDEMIFVDGASIPSINGTGTEDYYNGAWDFGGLNGALSYDYLYTGAPYIADAERIGGRYCLYRWHIENPVTFKNSIRVTMEHGHANHRSDNFYSTAYWYQTEPHSPFPELPPVADRVPRVMAVGGPGATSVHGPK